MIELLEKTGKEVTIMRGLPGSGKTKWAWENVLEPKGTDPTGSWQDKLVRHCSADNFFYVEEPSTDLSLYTPSYKKVYKYDIKRQGEAHEACRAEFLKAIKECVPNIVVDNTGSRRWEYENYITLAKMHNYDVKIVEMMCPDKDWLRIFIERQEHGVPPGVVLEMWYRWEADKRVTQEIWP